MFLQLFIAIFLPFLVAFVHTISGPIVVDRIGLPCLQNLQLSRPGANGRYRFWQDDSLIRIFFSMTILIPHSVFALTIFLSYSIRRPFNITFAVACIYSLVEIVCLVVANILLPYLLVYVCNTLDEPLHSEGKITKSRINRKKKKGKLLRTRLPPLPKNIAIKIVNS